MLLSCSGVIWSIPSIKTQWGGKEGHLTLFKAVYEGWNIALFPFFFYTWINVQVWIHTPRYLNPCWHWLTFTHACSYGAFLLPSYPCSTPLSHTHTRTHLSSVYVCYEWRERGRTKKMKNEPNNVRPKAAPIKRINGAKVCKDGVEVLWLLLYINTSWMSVVERGLLDKKKIAHFAENKCKCSEARFRMDHIFFFSSGLKTLIK